MLVYFLMVVNFQSWTDPFIIITALPGALCGIIWMLFVTGTTLNVPSLMGAIMAIGVATSNSILLVTFANDERAEGKNALEAALSAGHTRLRPVVMTALAMIIGMLPMSLGLGEGGEQNAPLGRAVIGGLLVATFATLFFVPVVYSLLRKGELGEDPDKEFEEQWHEGEAGRKDQDRKKEPDENSGTATRTWNGPAAERKPQERGRRRVPMWIPVAIVAFLVLALVYRDRAAHAAEQCAAGFCAAECADGGELRAVHPNAKAGRPGPARERAGEPVDHALRADERGTWASGWWISATTCGRGSCWRLSRRRMWSSSSSRRGARWRRRGRISKSRG